MKTLQRTTRQVLQYTEQEFLAQLRLPEVRLRDVEFNFREGYVNVEVFASLEDVKDVVQSAGIENMPKGK